LLALLNLVTKGNGDQSTHLVLNSFLQFGPNLFRTLSLKLVNRTFIMRQEGIVLEMK